MIELLIFLMTHSSLVTFNYEATRLQNVPHYAQPPENEGALTFRAPERNCALIDALKNCIEPGLLLPPVALGLPQVFDFKVGQQALLAHLPAHARLFVTSEGHTGIE